jgi:hypothetical protein
VTPGSTYYLKVDGADATAFGTGAYAVTLDAGPNPAPVVPLPDTMVAAGTAIGGGVLEKGRGHQGKNDDLVCLPAGGLGDLLLPAPTAGSESSSDLTDLLTVVPVGAQSTALAALDEVFADLGN